MMNRGLELEALGVLNEVTSAPLSSSASLSECRTGLPFHDTEGRAQPLFCIRQGRVRREQPPLVFLWTPQARLPSVLWFTIQDAHTSKVPTGWDRPALPAQWGTARWWLPIFTSSIGKQLEGKAEPGLSSPAVSLEMEKPLSFLAMGGGTGACQVNPSNTPLLPP